MKILPTISELGAASGRAFTAHGRLFMGIGFVSEGATFALNVFGMQGDNAVQFVTALASLLISFWGIYALLVAIKKPTLSLSAAYGEAWQGLSGYLWVNVLIFLALAVGLLLLVIPGILAAFFFIFAPYVFVWEGVGGVKAMRTSYRYVRPHAWAVAVRMAPVFSLALFGLTGGYIAETVFGTPGNLFEIVFGVLIVPFLAIYQFFLYDSLRRNQPLS
jgi:hypothetical protein